MTFISLEFLIFFPIVLALNLLTSSRFKPLLLLIVSIYFYMTFERQNTIFLFIFIIFFYFLSFLTWRIKNLSVKKILYIFSITVLIVYLILSKYFIFILDNLNFIPGIYSIPNMSLMSILGISYIVFQLIAYYSDVFNNKIQPERNFIRFALFISFFPRVLSGPIERGSGLLPQFKEDKKFNINDFVIGLKMFIWGYFAKVVISDRLAVAVNSVFSEPAGFDSLQVIVSTVFYSFQLYTDFMGYTFMALGSAGMLGYRLTNNFHMPYLAQSVSEFWKRWHLSLSFWLRDYIFLPLSYKIVRFSMKLRIQTFKPENISYVISTFLTMLICGLWHGPKWTFVIWGLLHSLFMIVSFLFRNKRKRIIKKLNIKQNNLAYVIYRIFITFFLINFSFVFFRSDNVIQVFEVLNRLFILNLNIGSKALFYNVNELIISWVMIIFLIIFEIIQFKRDNRSYSYPFHKLINLPVLILLIVLIIIFGRFGESDFIYFRF